MPKLKLRSTCRCLVKTISSLGIRLFSQRQNKHKPGDIAFDLEIGAVLFYVQNPHNLSYEPNIRIDLRKDKKGNYYLVATAHMPSGLDIIPQARNHVYITPR